MAHHDTDITTHDNVAHIVSGSNDTAQADKDSKEKEQEIRLNHEASLRFVPEEFISLLGKRRLAEVVTGDHIEIEMSVLFTDLRQFTTTVEGLSVEDAFEYLNEYMQLVQKPVQAHGGFVLFFTCASLQW